MVAVSPLANSSRMKSSMNYTFRAPRWGKAPCSVGLGRWFRVEGLETWPFHRQDYQYYFTESTPAGSRCRLGESPKSAPFRRWCSSWGGENGVFRGFYFGSKAGILFLDYPNLLFSLFSLFSLDLESTFSQDGLSFRRTWRRTS